MRIWSCLLVLVLAVVALARDEKVGETATKLLPDEKALLTLLNQTRRKEKLPEVTLNPVLVKVARAHSANMARKEMMSHVLDGKGVAQRVDEAGYDYRVVAENLAKAESDANPDLPAPPPEDIHKGWMESKSHRKNILDERFREVGFGIVRSKKGTYFYTQVFATTRRK